MKLLKTFFSFLHRKRYLQFLLTGGSGIMLNMLITWSLTEFVFGVDRYLIGYLIGATVNVCYNFALHTLLTFQTTRQHKRRFIGFIAFSLMSAAVQIVIVHLLTEFFGREHYLIIISGTIAFLSIVSFLFFKHTLFNEGKHTFHKDTEYLMHTLASLADGLSGAWSRIRKFLSHDTRVICIILLLAVATRLPFLSYPNRTLFDETIYLNYTIHTVDAIPFFDIHPPLARMVFATIASKTLFTLTGTPMALDQGFGDFPYVALRGFIALCGILLPLALYGIGRRLGYVPHVALIPALFVIFDNAFTLASRAILPDMFMLALNFIGLFAVLTATATKKKSVQLVAIFSAGLLFGAALAMKWTALGVLTLGLAWFIYKKKWGAAFSTLMIALLVYGFVFYSYFTMFPRGGLMDPMLSPYNQEWINSVAYPRGDEPGAILRFIPQFHKLIQRANSDPDISAQILQTPGPLSWPTAQSAMQFWISKDHTRLITLTGNSVLWVAAFFALLFELGWIMGEIIRKRVWPISTTETFLLGGYFANYFPFLLIDRPMHLYHYFTALLFLLLLLPRITPRIIDCITQVSRDRLIGYVMVIFVCVGVFVNFFLLSPTTYGF